METKITFLISIMLLISLENTETDSTAKEILKKIFVLFLKKLFIFIFYIRTNVAQIFVVCFHYNKILGLISTHSDENSLSLKDSSQDDVENNNITEEDDEDFRYIYFITLVILSIALKVHNMRPVSTEPYH